jgi:hypothetical protein
MSKRQSSLKCKASERPHGGSGRDDFDDHEEVGTEAMMSEREQEVFCGRSLVSSTQQVD